MTKLLKKVASLILSVGIVLSSSGLTILNHFCTEQQRAFVSVEGIYYNICAHHETLHSCCNSESKSECHSTENNKPELSIKSTDDCCKDEKIFGKIDLLFYEKKSKKIGENIKITQKIEFVKGIVSKYINQKIGSVETNVINPINKIIRYIRIISNLLNPSDKSAL